MAFLGLKGDELKGIGSIASALATAWGMHEQNKYNNKMLDFERNRVAKQREDEEKAQAAYEAVWSKPSDDDKKKKIPT